MSALATPLDMKKGHSVNSVASAQENAPIFLRWAGGKRWAIPSLRKIFPAARFERYIEPFLGGGSLFLGWGHQIAEVFLLSDKELALIETYKAVRDSPDRVIAALQQWPQNKTAYLKVRGVGTNGSSISNAARFIFLNRLCWNGLFRLNRSGEFNVPYGRKKMPADLPRLINLAAARLRAPGVDLRTSDYRDSVRHAGNGDLLIVDPPYVERRIGQTPHRYYNVDQFTWDDQKMLAAECRAAVSRGAVVVCTPGRGAHVLYSERTFQKIRIFRNQIFAADSNSRKKYRENLLVSRNWSPHAK